MTFFGASVLSQAGDELGNFLPHLVGAIALLLIGIVIVRLLARALIRALKAVGLDEQANRAGVNRVLERAGLGSSLAVVIGRAIRIALEIVVVFAALSLLGLAFLSDSLNKGIQELPKLLIAAALLLAGVVLAGYARERGDRISEQMDLPVPVGRIAQVTVLAIFAVIALAQIAVSTIVLLLLVGILLAGATATLAIAFGLGARDVARALSAGRYLRQNYDVGQEIGFAGVRGEVISIDSTSITLHAADGTSLRVPNHLLLENVVTIYRDSPSDHDGESDSGRAD
jgi:small-conductance mechanosensitive channel